MQGYVYLKHKLGGGSILSATIPAVTDAKHQSFTCAEKKTLEDGRRSNSYRSVMMNSCVASGVLFSFGFFPSQFFLTEVFQRGFFPWVCWPHAQNKLFFSWLTPASAFVRSHSCWMHMSGACCLYSVHYLQWQRSQSCCTTLHMGG